MKKKLITFICFSVILYLGFLLIDSYHPNVDYPLKIGNNLSTEIYENNFVTQLSNPVNQYDMDIPEGFELISENSHLQLYLEEETMGIIIVNKDNGYVWYSYDVSRDYDQEIADDPNKVDSINLIKSGIILQLYSDFRDNVFKSLLEENLLGNKTVTITYEFSQTGFTAHIDYTDIDIKFDVKVNIENEDLVIEVPYESIDEYDPKLGEPGNKDVLINNILVYPFLGATKKEENGYVVIPDGSGAIVSLQETPSYQKVYNAPVYGEDLGYIREPDISMTSLTVKPFSRITLPIYGMIHDVGNAGFMVISESGDYYATYNYKPKVETDYYQSYYAYNYREEYHQFQSRSNEDQNIIIIQKKLNQYDLKQRYVFLSQENADYVGVAKTYRKYLEEKQHLNTITNHSNYETKIDIIGNEIEMGILWEKNVPTTTYQEAIDMIKTIKDDGYQNLDVSYKTFDKDHHAYRFNIFRHLGGKDDFKKMHDYLENNGVDFHYYVDYVKSYEAHKYSATRMNRKALSDANLSYMYPYFYVNNAKYLPQFVQEDYPLYDDNGISSLTLNGLDQILYTHKDKERNNHYCNENIEYVKEALQYLKDKGISINSYNPDAYLYPYINKYYDAPISSSGLLFIDATIPLLELVVSGHMPMYSPYLNFISSEENTLLRLVEYGVNPSYILTKKNTYELKYTNSSHIYISQYEALDERMKIYDSFIKKALSRISGVEMVDHYFYQEGVSVSVYANGLKVVVNYTDSDVIYNGNTIEAKGYDVL